MGIELDPSNLERSHRLGRFTENKSRPIIVKLLRFKDKESILAAGHKLKNTTFAVREDFSESVRLARGKLYQFAEPQNVPFKIRFDKLHIHNKRYIYDPISDCVKEPEA